MHEANLGIYMKQLGDSWMYQNIYCFIFVYLGKNELKFELKITWLDKTISEEI